MEGSFTTPINLSAHPQYLWIKLQLIAQVWPTSLSFVGSRWAVDMCHPVVHLTLQCNGIEAGKSNLLNEKEGPNP
jgi:hypothetical protein